MKSKSTTTPGISPASRGLPTILWNNDSEDLTWTACGTLVADFRALEV